MTTQIEAAIQEYVAGDERVTYALVPSPSRDVRAKSAMQIINHPKDPIWHIIISYSATYPAYVSQRVLAEVAEDDPGGYDDVTVLSVTPIEG
jgi:hypothetical protein